MVISWNPVQGATGYKVAARLMNGVEPFAWTEYEAESPPHVIAERWMAMSGLRYEVRAAAVGADGQSDWSASVSTTAPALRPAPPGSIHIDSRRDPLVVGGLMRVSVAARPVARRSPYVFSACGIERSGCELLPMSESSTYPVSSALGGKKVRVQVDYDKGGLSYTASAVVGVVGPSVSDGTVYTHLHLLKTDSVQLRWDAAKGGAIEPWGNDLLVVTPWGRIALVRSDGSAERMEERVPMGLERLRPPAKPRGALGRLDLYKFRVADVLLRQRTPQSWDMFVAHHYLAEEGVLFRVSSTTIFTDDNGQRSALPSWRTVFDIGPLLFDGRNLDLSGGRMLTEATDAEEPDHLLIVVGDHGSAERAQAPESHLGKFLRVGIETGSVHTLAVGFRNPQGLARDGDGNLWATEHGPRGGDELNLLEAGANYGWPSASYGNAHGGAGIGSGLAGEHAASVAPAFAWVPSIGVSAVLVNDDTAFPLWKDDLLVGSLSGACQNRRNCAGHALFRVRREGTAVRYVERIELGQRIRDLAKMPDGRIAVLADGGRVRFLSRASKFCDQEPGERRHVYALGCVADSPDGGAEAKPGRP